MKGSRDLLLEFWDPFLVSGRFELETSNLACRLITAGALTTKMKKIGQKRVGKGSRGLLFKVWDPFLISGTFELKTLNVTCRLTTGALTKKCKIRSKVPGRGHVTYFCNLGPLLISGRVYARNFKFGMQIDYRGH